MFKCPYANVAAVLVDCIRTDTVAAWSSDESMDASRTFSNSMPPSALLSTDHVGEVAYKSRAIVDFAVDVLAQAAERDLLLHADLMASCLSLYRFIRIRDKVGTFDPNTLQWSQYSTTRTVEQDNQTGVLDHDEARAAIFARVHKRLHQKIHEDGVPEGSNSAASPSGHAAPAHLFLLEAALTSTLSLDGPV